jgi:ABC-type multidrug transport system ATPase subunit
MTDVEKPSAPATDLKPYARSRSSRQWGDFAWNNLNFSAKGTKILTDCWGSVPAGQVCAIMGPSGAGKSSLLNVLAGRSSSAAGISISGNVMVGGTKVNPVSFRKNIAYVMQDDALVETATPREALAFSAKLRLPPGFTHEQINQRVDELLSELGIQDCADTMIGGALIKGISGGQRKRTSVGIELITDPSLLFLDEPTSGLDSFSAYNLVTQLKRVADTNTVVLCTIHQPSSEVFFLFDIVIFMKEGRIFYQGPVEDIVAYFNRYGYPCPENYNPSDFVMSVCQSGKTADFEEKAMFMQNPQIGPDGMVKMFSDSLVDSDVPSHEIKASFFKQLSLLLQRDLAITYRDKGALGGRFGVTILLNIIFGVIFLGAGNQDDSVQANISSHFGAITMVATSSMFGTATPVMLSFPFERPIFMREYSTGSYSAGAYFISKMVMELPLAFIQGLVQFIIVYFLVQYQGNFILLVLTSWGVGVVSSSTAVILGCLVGNAKQVTEFAPVIFQFVTQDYIFLILFISWYSFSSCRNYCLRASSSAQNLSLSSSAGRSGCVP